MYSACRMSNAGASAPPVSPYAATRVIGVPESAGKWTEYIVLGKDHASVDLGAGYPDFHAPGYIRQSLANATTSERGRTLNQYTRHEGHPRLVNALSKLYSPLYGRTIDPMTEILATIGAYGSLFCAIQAFVNPGDEVIFFEPAYDCYHNMLRYAGAIPKALPLLLRQGGTSAADLCFEPDRLEAMFTDKTKMIVINTPHNPSGKVFSRSELDLIASLCIKHDVLCLSDEVYEWLVYDTSPEHVRIATLPGMQERTLTVGSAGKTFSLTGWKLGWTVGPAPLVRCCASVQGLCMGSCSTILQEAVGEGLEHEISKIGTSECYLTSLAAELKPKRDWLAKTLTELGLTPIIPEGGYFMLVDTRPLGLNLPEDGRLEDSRFVYWLAENKGIATVPASLFCSETHRHLAKGLVRFCFCKEDKTLEKVAEICKEWKASMRSSCLTLT